MYKIDNYLILKEKNMKLYNALTATKETLNDSVKVVSSKAGIDTLSIMHEGKEHFYHSKYNPINDAKVFSTPYLNLEDKEHILFIGVGLGYHVSEILTANPTIKFSIFEPNQAVLRQFFEHFKLKKYSKRIVEVFCNIEQIKNKQVFFKYYSSKTEDIILPIVKQLYGTEIAEFQTSISDAMKERKLSTQIDSALQQRWTVNPIINFPKIIKNPNLLIDLDREKFINKPAIIVAAGPSLAEDMEYIRQIKKEGRAYVFAVGSGVNALIANDIYPDAFFSIDPNFINSKVVENIKESKLDVTLVFGSSIGFEVLEDYPGKMISFMLNQDKFSQYLLEYGDDIVTYDAESVANMTLQPLMKLGMNPIIFAGQNLAYLNNRIYSEGIKYNHHAVEVTEKHLEEQIEVISVTGEKLSTSPYYLRMKLNMEYHIANNPSLQFINTTKNGAHIEGTEFIPIEKVLSDYLVQENVVFQNWHEAVPSYDLAFVRKKYKKLENSFDELMKLIDKCLEYLTILSNMNKKGNYKDMELYLTAYDKLFELIQDNDFFEVIICPMTRVQHENFIINSPDVAQEKSPRKKIKLFEDIFGNYLKTIYGAIIDVQPAFAEFNKSNLFEKEE